VVIGSWNLVNDGGLSMRETLWMPHYFFHLEHVRVVKDREGSEHADLEAAKLHAVKTVASALADEPQAFWDSDVFRMTVSKRDGLVLFTIEMFATMAPAGGRRSPKGTPTRETR
jgi:hypothetical protein